MNRLSTVTSPYLLQHAHNPVDWYPWGEEALNKARAENKPIFLSIGYSACHWCHVLAHESFEDPEVAAFMNEHFVNIKVDREERPDLDGIYMQATMAMTGSGGWPMSVFLTPELKPFYAGTYFPPVRRYNMPAFRDVLAGIARTWREDPAEVDRVSTQLSDHLQQALNLNIKTETTFNHEQLDAAAQSLVDSYDWENGGWGAAPKFPQPMAIEFLLRRVALSRASRKGNADEVPLIPSSSPSLQSASQSPARGEELKVAIHALKAMARGGMYNVVGGGFSRYSVDQFWRVPHFEKMLYDNAQLVRAYLHAWQITGDEFFKRIVIETLDFIEREMTHPDGGFYSSLDADSEGEEGKFYVWTLEEIRDVLKEESEFFEAAYGITARGNWEGKTVLQRAIDDSSLAARFKLDIETIPLKLAELHTRLLTARASRIRPGTDDKILTAWNGLMLATMAEAARVILTSDANEEIAHLHHVQAQVSSLPLVVPRNDNYYRLATRNAEFLLNSLRSEGKLRRSWRDGKVTSEVFLEDYAALILGLIELYQTDFNNKWFSAAQDLTDEMIELFSDPNGGFFDTAKNSEMLLLRPKDIQDNATPSGNALACEALLKLAAFTDNGNYRDLAEKSLGLATDMAARYPTAFARWLSGADFALSNVKQVAVVYERDGNQAQELIQVIEAEYRPNMLIAASAHPPSDEAPPLLMDRPPRNGKPTVYVCEGFICKNPVTTISELKELL